VSDRDKRATIYVMLCHLKDADATEKMHAGLSRPIRNKLLTKIHPRLSSFHPKISFLHRICLLFVISLLAINVI